MPWQITIRGQTSGGRTPGGDRPVRSVETEVLSADLPGLEDEQKLIGFLAQVMDSMFLLPGTNIRFGLEPIIGLLPGFGDFATAMFSMWMIARCSRLGVPKIILARMAINVILTAVIGMLPFVGDLFCVWFKPNIRNYELLKTAVNNRNRGRAGDWIFVCALVLVAALICGAASAGLLWIFAKLIIILKAAAARAS